MTRSALAAASIAWLVFMPALPKRSGLGGTHSPVVRHAEEVHGSDRSAGSRSYANATRGSLALVDHVEVIGPVGSLVREPMVVQHRSGALFVTGYEAFGASRLFESTNSGASWADVTYPSAVEPAPDNSDVDLAVAPDGTIYFAKLGIDRKRAAVSDLVVGSSRDTGKTWHWSTLAVGPVTDRDWVAVAPDGAAHVIWNDGHGVLYAASRDAGISWSRPVRISEQRGVESPRGWTARGDRGSA